MPLLLSLLFFLALRRVYPPCPVSHLVTPTSLTSLRRPLIISVSQFRPEKNHELQIIAFAKFVSSSYISRVRAQFAHVKSATRGSALPPTSPRAKTTTQSPRSSRTRSKISSSHTANSALPGLPSPADFDGRPKLVLIGGCRDASDEARVAKLREFAASLSVEHDVEFQINVDSRTLASYLGSALICVHTMWNEHFGISCVEAQASGCVLLAHNSGGPRQDIAVVQDGTPRSHVCSLRMLSLIVFHCYR